MEDGRIYIPSYKRAHRILRDTSTLAFVPKAMRHLVTVIVREEEAEEYDKILNGYGVSLGVIPQYTIEEKEKELNRKFLWADTMDAIIDTSIHNLDIKAIIMDDDLSMSFRENMHSGSPKKMNENQFVQMYDDLVSGANPPLAGIIFRGFCSAHTSYYEENAPINGIFAIDCAFFNRHKDARFANTKALHMPDRALVLRLLQNGYKNRVYCRYCYNDVTDTSGGCSTNRPASEHSQSAIELSREFPGIVSLTTKTNLGDTRIGTLVQWKKAYKEKSHGQG